jgi:lipoprotein NlpI
MRCPVFLVLLTALSILTIMQRTAGADPVDDLLKSARAALAKGQTDEALALTRKAIRLDPKSVPAYVLQGTSYEVAQRHHEAITAFDKAIALDPRAAEAYNRRGSERFKIGQIQESIADFDKYLELKPEEKPGHWKRGISYYYAGSFDEGRRQFEGYETVDTNDVENAVWRYLCMARRDGVAKARKVMLKIGNDRRVPMMEIYALFSGRAKPADVLAAARAGQPSAEQLNERLFYAHLYIGLYYEAEGDRKQTLEHLAKAAEEHKIGHYMWDVARVHLELLRKEAKPK